MKHIFYYSIFLFVFSFNSIKFDNSISGKIIYSFKPNELDVTNKEKNKDFYKAFDYLNKAASNLVFSLTFNTSESFFEIEKKLDLDIETRVYSYAENIITKGNYYFDKKNDAIYIEGKIYDKYTLIKSKASNTKWKITNETKNIGGYNCIKAICVKRKTNSIKSKNYTVEAWFTMDIPVNYGPLEYNGLPGLILEVKSANFTFFVKKIELSNEKINVKKLFSKNIITAEQHQENLKKLRDNN